MIAWSRYFFIHCFHDHFAVISLFTKCPFASCLEAVDCPAFSGGTPPSCTCNSGYSGTVVAVAAGYTSTCAGEINDRAREFRKQFGMVAWSRCFSVHCFYDHLFVIPLLRAPPMLPPASKLLIAPHFRAAAPQAVHATLVTVAQWWLSQPVIRAHAQVRLMIGEREF